MKTQYTSLLSIFLLVCLNTVTGQSIVLERMSDTETIVTNKYSIPYNKVAFSVSAGYSVRTGKADKILPKEFTRKMRSGVNFGADLVCFPSYMWGLGAKFQGRNFNAKWNTLQDKVRTYYIAPVFLWRSFDRRSKNAFVYGVSAGYMAYKDKVNEDGRTLNSVSKGTFGATSEIGYDIRISPKSFFGFKMSATVGYAHLTVNGEKLREDLCSFDLSAGLRF